MLKKILLSGNEATAEGAIQSGCRFYAGYPITPQNELTAYMAKRMPEVKGVFVQAESEIAAVNMVFGASCAGARAMTSSSSPGISLKQEGISYLAGTELPAVIVNVMRGGPGLGNIAPAQSDYFQATRSGGHGDYHSIVLAPSTVQETYLMMPLAFALADQYRLPAMVLSDGMLGQMMEPVLLSQKSPDLVGMPINREKVKNKRYEKPWALTGCQGRKPNIIRSLYLKEGALEQVNLRLQKKYQLIRKSEQRYEELYTQDARIVLVAYGTMARIARGVVKKLRQQGKKVGLIRPITLWPFPEKAFIRSTVGKARHTKRLSFLVVEMSYGQMLEDVKLVINGEFAVEFLGRAGGGIPTEAEIIKKIRSLP